MLKNILLEAIHGPFAHKLFAFEGDPPPIVSGAETSEAKALREKAEKDTKEKDVKVKEAADKIKKEDDAKVKEEHDKALKELKELKEEKAAREKKQLEDDGKFKELSEKSEKDKLAAIKEKDEAIEKANKRVIETEARLALVNAGAGDPDLVKLLDLSAVKVDGEKVTGLSEAIDAFKKSKPDFFKTVKRSTTGSNPPPAAKEDDEVEIVDVTKLSKKEYEEHKRKLFSSFARK